MRRREIITLIGGAAVAWPLAARAQQAGKQPAGLRRIGVLMALDESEPEGKAQLLGFTQGLSELGWTVGTNLQMEIRWGAGDVNRIGAFAKELVAMRPDVILSQGTPVTAALRQETRTIPIVFVTVTDPVGEGFVAGLPSPGGNTTGFITSEAAMGSKLLELLMDIAPGIKRVAMIFNPDTAPRGGMYYFSEFDAAARTSKVEPIAARAWSDAEIESVITSVGSGSGLIVMPDYFMLNHSRPIISLAAQNNVPVIYPWRFVVTRDGGLISYGPDFRDIVRRAAPYVHRILRGANPGELPVQVPTKFEMAVNIKAAKALGLKVPPSILIAADEVIE
jgi:putative tryptophan/tyrosine transport system substrate-binding protein